MASMGVIYFLLNISLTPEVVYNGSKYIRAIHSSACFIFLVGKLNIKLLCMLNLFHA